MLSLKKQMLLNTIGTVFYMGCQWLMSVLIVRMSGYEAAGMLTFAISITNVFSAIALFSMRQYQVSDLDGQYDSATYIVSRYFTSILATLLCLLYAYISVEGYQQILCVLAYMVIKATEAVIDVYHGILQKYIRYDLICFSYVIRGSLSLIIFITVMYKSNNLAFTLSVISFVLLCFCIVYDRKKINMPFIRHPDIHWGKLCELLKMCFPLVIFNFVITYIPILPRLIYQMMYGTNQLGIYGSVSMPTMLINVVAILVFNPLIPIVKKIYQEKNVKQFHLFLIKIIGFIVIIGITAILLANLMGEWVLVLLFSESILPYANILIPIILSAISIALVWVISNVLITIRKIKELVIVSIGSMLLELMAIKNILIKWGMNGISYCAIIFLSIIASVLFIIAWFSLSGKHKQHR